MHLQKYTQTNTNTQTYTNTAAWIKSFQFNSIHQLFIPRKYKKNVVVINTIGQSNMQISHQYHKAMNIR